MMTQGLWDTRNKLFLALVILGTTAVVNGVNSGGGNRVYTFQLGALWGGHQYLNEQGRLAGFTKDLIMEVCQLAGITCKTVWDSYANCWKSVAGENSVGGIGLFDRWYDACPDLQGTQTRMEVFDFGIPYLKTSLSHFFVKEGVTDFDPTDITGKTIGFVESWNSDEKCVARQSNLQGNTAASYTAKLYWPVDAAAEALQNGEVDALFNNPGTFDRYTADTGNVFTMLDSVGYPCVVQGNGIMTRKDSDLIPLWNKGFVMLKRSGRFAQMCSKAQAKHGHMGFLKQCDL